MGVIEKAQEELSALCHGKKWRMTIPVRDGIDSDTVFGALIREATALRAEVECLRKLKEVPLARKIGEENSILEGRLEGCRQQREAQSAALSQAREALDAHQICSNATDDEYDGSKMQGMTEAALTAIDSALGSASIDKVLEGGA